jgi:TonB family protein
MNISYVNHELNAIQSHTRRYTGLSALIHITFFLLLFLMRTIAPGPEKLVEITWIDPAPIKPVATKTTAPPGKKELVRRSSDFTTKEHFEREMPRAEVTPESQMLAASEDKLVKRLATLQRAAVENNVQIAGITPPSALTKPVLAGIPTEQERNGTPGELARQQSRGAKPVELARKPTNVSKPAIASIATPKVEATPEPAKASDNTARRTLAGASLVGPVANRSLISYQTPVYPEWAKREGVEGSSSIYFVVLPDGRIKKSVVVEKTSGFEDFDRNAIDALLTWRFEALQGSQVGEQWGTITFHYRLNSTTSN